MNQSNSRYETVVDMQEDAMLFDTLMSGVLETETAKQILAQARQEGPVARVKRGIKNVVKIHDPVIRSYTVAGLTGIGAGVVISAAGIGAAYLVQKLVASED